MPVERQTKYLAAQKFSQCHMAAIPYMFIKYLLSFWTRTPKITIGKWLNT